MGQYFQPIILDDDGKPMKSFDSHYYGSGLKLMEHSWLGNDFVAAVESYLVMDAALPLVWCGDYADEDLWSLVTPDMEVRFFGVTPPPYLTVSSTGGQDLSPNARRPMKVTAESHPLIVNMTKGEYVDKREVPGSHDQWDGDWRIHPLPVLTANSNGRGGGDYRGPFPYVGRWATDRIAVVSADSIIDGFAKLDVSMLVER